MEPAYSPSYMNGQGLISSSLLFPNFPKIEDNSPDRRDQENEESASFSKYSNKSPNKLQQEGFEYQEGEDGEDGSPIQRHEDPGIEEEDEAMRHYEEQEAEILQYCEENNCLWEDKDFPPITNSIYTVPLLLHDWDSIYLGYP